MLIPTVAPLHTSREKRGYFDNDVVENLLVPYVQGGCTSIELRDEIMGHAVELVRQVILFNTLHRLVNEEPEQLITVGWEQVERVLYKYKARPHCFACYDCQNPGKSQLYDPAPTEYGILTPEEVAERELVCPNCKQKPEVIVYRGTSKIFNMWTTVARTSILAHAKSQNRGRNNLKTLGEHVSRQKAGNARSIHRFCDEAEERYRYDETNLKIIRALRTVYLTKNDAHKAVIADVVSISRCSRAAVSKFFAMCRLGEWTDDPREKLDGQYSMSELLHKS